MKCNLGCGRNIKDGYYNFDKYDYTVRNWELSKLNYNDIYYLDLEGLPLIFKDNSIDEILLLNVLEHLWINPYDFMLDVYRILKDLGVIKIEMPFFANQIGHVRWFHKKEYFKPIIDSKNEQSFQQKKLFKLNYYKRIRSSKRYLFAFHHYWELVKIN